MRNWLKNVLYYSWRRCNVRPPLSLRSNLASDREQFKIFMSILEKTNYTIVYIDESTFNPSSLPLYSWSRIGYEPDKLIRQSDWRYNWIAALYEKKVLFNIKTTSSTEKDFWDFLELLMDDLELILNKNQLDKRTIFLFDNATIHKTKNVKDILKILDIVAFTFPPYSPELNKIEHVFGMLKKYLAKRNLANKEFLAILREEISKL